MTTSKRKRKAVKRGIYEYENGTNKTYMYRILDKNNRLDISKTGFKTVEEAEKAKWLKELELALKDTKSLKDEYIYQQEQNLENYRSFFTFFKKELQPLVERWDYLKHGYAHNQMQ